MIRSLLLILIVLFPLTSMAQNDLPESHGWVNDYAGVLSPEYKSKISYTISKLESQTSIEIVIVTIQSIAPYTERQYAQMLFDKWKIGKKGKDNGVLILLAIKERRWRLHTGYGLESVLTDVICSRIGSNVMSPFFTKGKYSEGLYDGVISIINIIYKESNFSKNYVLTAPRVVLPDMSLVYPGSVYIGAIFMILIVSSLNFSLFIMLPLVLIFTYCFFINSGMLWILLIGSTILSIFIRYFFWIIMPKKSRKSFGSFLINGNAWNSSFGGPRGGCSSSGGGGGGGSSGGSSGGGGASGGF